jgi:hypothetical protein
MTRPVRFGLTDPGRTGSGSGPSTAQGPLSGAGVVVVIAIAIAMSWNGLWVARRDAEALWRGGRAVHAALGGPEAPARTQRPELAKTRRRPNGRLGVYYSRPGASRTGQGIVNRFRPGSCTSSSTGALLLLLLDDMPCHAL